jgi:hypothetical protein
MKENVPITNPVEMVDPNWMSKTGGYAKDMTLRDYFAAQVIQGYAASEYYVDADNGGHLTAHWINDDAMARGAYAVADAMLKARKK